MNLIAFTQDLSIASFIGLNIGTKVDVISKEQFYKELNTPCFRGIYKKPTNKLIKADYQAMFNDYVSKDILDKLVVVDRVFYWTQDYKALYHIEYEDIPEQVNPPIFLRITRLEYNAPIEE